MTDEDIARFWSRARSRATLDDPAECWLWTPRRPGRHGQFIIAGRTIGAHRVSWMIRHDREIPPARCICHTCDVPACVNPDHLFLGTYADNARDRVAKGRWRSGGLRGETHPNAKLTADQVRAIRALHGTMPTKDIAARYEITASQVSNIHARRAWKHLTEDESE